MACGMLTSCWNDTDLMFFHKDTQKELLLMAVDENKGRKKNGEMVHFDLLWRDASFQFSGGHHSWKIVHQLKCDALM